MDSLANYGSDDEYEESSEDKTGTAKHGGTSGSFSPEADANYDEVQMDLSEESNNNNSNEDDDRRRDNSTEQRRSQRSRSRSRDDLKRNKRNRTSDHRPKDEEKRKHEGRSKYAKEGSSTSEDKSKRSLKERSKHREDKSKKHKRSDSKERKRSTSRDRKHSPNREKKRSSSRERRRSRSPKRSEFRKRSDEDRGNNRYNSKRFDRTSNKMAQLEKLGIEIKTPDAEFVTPQMLLQRSMDEQVQKVKNSTGIELPKYYNPNAMNPSRYADQMQKRRLLWQKKEVPKETKTSSSMGKVWEQTTFAQDSDGKVASKFKRLMGIKEDSTSSNKPTGRDIMKKQEEMFSSMEQQYEVARTATHTMRGVGLGFGTFQYPR